MTTSRYVFQPGNHVISYPATCQNLPAELPSVLAALESSFRKLLAVHPRGRDSIDPELILEAFRRFLQDISPRYGVPQWQVYQFGPGKWHYGKWLLDKLARFLDDQPKLLHTIAELERARGREREQEAEKTEGSVLEVHLSHFSAEEG